MSCIAVIGDGQFVNGNADGVFNSILDCLHNCWIDEGVMTLQVLKAPSATGPWAATEHAVPSLRAKGKMSLAFCHWTSVRIASTAEAPLLPTHELMPASSGSYDAV